MNEGLLEGRVPKVSTLGPWFSIPNKSLKIGEVHAEISAILCADLESKQYAERRNQQNGCNRSPHQYSRS